MLGEDSQLCGVLPLLFDYDSRLRLKCAVRNLIEHLIDSGGTDLTQDDIGVLYPNLFRSVRRVCFHWLRASNYIAILTSPWLLALGVALFH